MEAIRDIVGVVFGVSTGFLFSLAVQDYRLRRTRQWEELAAIETLHVTASMLKSLLNLDPKTVPGIGVGQIAATAAVMSRVENGLDHLRDTAIIAVKWQAGMYRAGEPTAGDLTSDRLRLADMEQQLKELSCTVRKRHRLRFFS